jgi:DNA-binding CsgD family transcriptional regulator
LLDRLAGPRVRGLHRLEKVQNVLRARGSPESQEPMVGVGKRPPAADGDEAGVAIFREDHFKGVRSDQILTAVRAVADGHAVFGPGLAARLLAPGDPELPGLSMREREVMEHVARGLTNIEIAEALVISPVTVRNHRSSILMKLQVTNRTKAVIKFRDSRQPD